MISEFSAQPEAAQGHHVPTLLLSRAQPQPQVSVVIPTYNRAESILRALDSVLAQTYEDFELIIVDDGSHDDTAILIRDVGDHRIRVIIHDTNKGAAAARNTAIRAASGHYIAFLDSDDFWAPEKLERQLAYMAAHQGRVRLSCTGFHYRCEETGRVETRLLEPVLSRKGLFMGCRCGPGSTLVAEASLFCEVGLLNERMRRLEDWE